MNLRVKNAEGILKHLFPWEKKKMSPALGAGVKISKSFSPHLALEEEVIESVHPQLVALLVLLHHAVPVNNSGLSR